MSELADRPEQWPVTSTHDIHRDDWIVALREDTLHRPGHPDEPFDRLVIEHPGAVMALAVDDDERVCCLRQYRHVVGRNFVELPAGLCDEAGEEPLETARRELREEAELEVFWTPMESLLDAVLDGRVQQSPLAVAVLTYDVLKRRGHL
jgi:8-oxo-dGTP pyrophosphatase MutT (NUDIX family)